MSGRCSTSLPMAVSWVVSSCCLSQAGWFHAACLRGSGPAVGLSWRLQCCGGLQWPVGSAGSPEVPQIRSDQISHFCPCTGAVCQSVIVCVTVLSSGLAPHLCTALYWTLSRARAAKAKAKAKQKVLHAAGQKVQEGMEQSSEARSSGRLPVEEGEEESPSVAAEAASSDELSVQASTSSWWWFGSLWGSREPLLGWGGG
jgi:hypothetical protein